MLLLLLLLLLAQNHLNVVVVKLPGVAAVQICGVLPVCVFGFADWIVDEMRFVAEIWFLFDWSSV